MNLDAIFFYLLSLVLAVATVAAGARLAVRYEYRFLARFRSSLIVYVVYLFLFFSGQLFLVEFDASAAGGMYLPYQAMSILAEPAWSVFVYLLLLWSAALVGWTVPRPVRWGYWVLQAVLYGATFVVLVAYGDAADRRSVIRLGRAVDVAIYAILYAVLLVPVVGAFRGRGRNRRALAARLAWAYLLGFGVATVATFTWLPWDSGIRLYLTSRALVYFLVNAAPLAILTRFLERNRLEPMDGEAEAEAVPLVLDDLTPREREIVPLVAEGFTNEEIGERLFISPKTVKNNISNVYRKLGIRNRVELANRYRQSEADRP